GYRPRVVITDRLASYPPALRRVLPGVEHRRHKRLNNRAENSHWPTRRRARALQRFKSPEHAQQFLAPFGPISDHFRPRRHRLPPPPRSSVPRVAADALPDRGGGRGPPPRVPARGLVQARPPPPPAVLGAVPAKILRLGASGRRRREEGNAVAEALQLRDVA